ncbi:hypothetical protein RGQ29_019149 [Quercus rubra]|uniref:non-specific serine/threonine protein kinase n=1 Tax=Quercus rubra TaxID=3512 RepID=A0AAN7F7L2_QUERU|nr:hypothetical protein RGQ29_019149 [Quercus rubra]
MLLWQSFDYPTDTLLPEMKIGLNRITGINSFLTSWKSQDDLGIGNYSFKLNLTGFPELLLYEGSTPYYRASPRPWNTPVAEPSLGFTSNFVNNEDEISYFSSLDDPSIVTRCVVDSSGLLQQITWNDGDRQWKQVWSTPKLYDNYGNCGAYNICIVDSTTRFACTCLPGYEPKSLRDGSEGRVRKKLGLSMCGNGEGFVKVAHLKAPDTFDAAWMDMSMSSLECELACLRNCSCTAFINYNTNGKGFGCLSFYGELIDILEFTDYGWDLNVRVDVTESTKYTRKSKGFLGKKRKLAITILSIAVPLFMGQLSNGQHIAVKRRSKSSGQGIEELKNEVMLIAKLEHRNLVKIFGCCIQEEEKMLIYEYMPNKSLDSFIFYHTRSSLLNWRKHFEIIVGITRGILYLHQDSRLRIIHRDLKTSNVLLDGEMNPKISDFDIARIIKGDQIQDKTTRVVRTYGYMSPEYVIFGKFSTKSDVFSFGVILLEIVSGKINTNSYQNHPSLTLIGHVWELWREDRALDIVDSSIKESFVSLEVLRCIQIGLLCVQEDATDRPTMLAVLFMLSSETTLPSPKQPAFIFRSATNDFESIIGGELYSINDVTITKFEGR